MRVLAGLVAVAMSGPAWGETVLRLSETARVSARPDELAASLRVEASGATASAAQGAANAAMAKAMAVLKAQPAIASSTNGYQVYQVLQPSPHWLAGQGIELASRNGDAVLAVVGGLQAQGVAVQGLTWRLSSETAAKVRDEATEKALRGLRGRAERAAGVLGMAFERFAEVRLDGAAPGRPQPRMVNAAMAMAAPVAEAGDVEVSATVEADAVLK